MFKKCFLLCVVSILLTVKISSASSIRLHKPFTIKLTAMLPLSGSIFPSGPACLAASEMVVDIFNNQSEILKDYNIVADLIDDQCNGAKGLKQAVPYFFNHAKSNGQWLGNKHLPSQFEFVHETAKYFYDSPVVGGAVCSSVCMQVAKLMKNSHKIQYTGSGCNSQVLDDGDKYPNTIRVWSAGQAADMFLDLAQVMEWKKVVVISDSQAYGIMMLKRLLKIAPQRNISIDGVEIFVDNPNEAISRLKSSGKRIIFSTCYTNTCQKIACEVS